MNEDERGRDLWRRAGTGDLQAAVDYVVFLLRGVAPVDPSTFRDHWVCVPDAMISPQKLTHPPEEACRVFLRPRAVEEMVGQLLTAREAYAGSLNRDYKYNPALTITRWLFANPGRVVVLRSDLAAFEAVEPTEYVKTLEARIQMLEGWVLRMELPKRGKKT